MKRICIANATIINESRTFVGSVLIENDRIARIIAHDGQQQLPICDETVDAKGCYLLPGIIDDHVHFREPGLTHKADIESESRAAAAGGVTSYFDMPNTSPQTTTLKALEEKREIAAKNSLINYSFFFGATNTNAEELSRLDTKRTCGVKLFMGSSTGNMLVNEQNALERIFRTSPLPIMVHCEDSQIIDRNMRYYQSVYGFNPDIRFHPLIRSAEACYRSTALAVCMANESGAKLHIAHVSTAHELELIRPENPLITAEACIAHLLFCDKDYATLGTKIKCNPSVKTEKDRDALRKALTDGRIAVIGTDHAPHLLTEKEGGAATAVSGMPMIQFSLVSALELVESGILDIEQLVRLMCHNPAKLFDISERGFLREGYKADMVLIRRKPWTLTSDMVKSKCKWSPLEGKTFKWRVEQTFCNGIRVYDAQTDTFAEHQAGEEICFNR